MTRHDFLIVEDNPPWAGYCLWAEFASGLNDVALARRAYVEGIFIAPGAVFLSNDIRSMAKVEWRAGMRISLACADDSIFVVFLQAELAGAF